MTTDRRISQRRVGKIWLHVLWHEHGQRRFFRDRRVAGQDSLTAEQKHVMDDQLSQSAHEECPTCGQPYWQRNPTEERPIRASSGTRADTRPHNKVMRDIHDQRSQAGQKPCTAPSQEGHAAGPATNLPEQPKQSESKGGECPEMHMQGKHGGILSNSPHVSNVVTQGRDCDTNALDQPHSREDGG